MFRAEQLCLPALVATLATGCAVGAEGLQPDRVPAHLLSESSRFVVVTVPNAPASLPLQAGSTRGGYSPGPYVSSGAKRVGKELQRDYGLTEATAWPIQALHLYCIVFRLASTQESASLIRLLERDPRVQSAQPLNEFQTRVCDAPGPPK
jgi:hypothetical protein